MLTVTREKVVELAQAMPLEKLASWYQFGLFLRTNQDELASAQLDMQMDAQNGQTEAELLAELAAWEAAGVQDWLAFEVKLSERRALITRTENAKFPARSTPPQSPAAPAPA